MAKLKPGFFIIILNLLIFGVSSKTLTSNDSSGESGGYMNFSDFQEKYNKEIESRKNNVCEFNLI